MLFFKNLNVNRSTAKFIGAKLFCFKATRSQSCGIDMWQFVFRWTMVTRYVCVRITKVLLRVNKYSLCCVYAGAYEVVSGCCIAGISEVQKTSSFRCWLLVTSELAVSCYWQVHCNLSFANTVVRRLTTGIPSEKCVVSWFRSCANFIELGYMV